MYVGATSPIELFIFLTSMLELDWWPAEVEGELAADEEDVANALKLFKQERRKDTSAQDIADHLKKAVETVIDALKRLDCARERPP
jgi:hypothetical protein